MYVSQHRHPSRFVALQGRLRPVGAFGAAQGRGTGSGASAVRYKAATSKQGGWWETGGSNKSQQLRLPFPNRFFPGLPLQPVETLTPTRARGERTKPLPWPILRAAHQRL